jgi:type I restriction enzyme R subunit
MLGKEKPVQQKIVRELAAVGWTPVSQKDMNDLRKGRMGEALVEPLLVDALRNLNPELSETDALQVVDALRRVPDSETFLSYLRDGFDVSLNPDEDAPHISVVDWLHPNNNDYVVTDEFALKTGAIREPQLDVCCLVNGIPLGQIETKAMNEDWKKAVSDFEGYWADAPDLERFGAVCVATNGWRFRCAPVGARGASSYAEWKDTWPHDKLKELAGEDRELEIGLLGLLDPHNLADIAANFIVYETRKGVTKKKLARYQQFRAANKLVKRVVEGKYDRGIVWHTQGSGKSLTMLFAARKLKNVGLSNPTIVIVIDRRDLDDQINETFTACQFEGVSRALNRDGLRKLLATDKRGVIITTVQKFEEQMKGLSTRDNVIVFVDEAHRTQLGESIFGMSMRAALPNAKLFAFTGTPIETDDRSTRRAFAPEIDGKYESYLDSYSPKQAVADKATVETRYQPRLVELAHFKEGDLDASFEALVDELEDEKREKVKADAARLKVLASAPARVEAVSADALQYLREHTFPQGFKAQFVAVDRDGCALVADELLRLGMAPEELAVIYTPRTKEDAKPENEHLRRWYAEEQWKRLHGTAPTDDETPVDEDTEIPISELKARKAFIEAFKEEEENPKLLIVTDMLLTGFDAPVEQVMFLDKPLRGAKLLQAIMRTNRPLPEKNKDRGVIVDYWGVFDRMEEAFREFSPEDVEMAVLDLKTLEQNFPVVLAEALAVVAGMPAEDEYEQMMWLLRRLMTDAEAAELFEERFQAAQSVFETLAPDPVLLPYLDDYRRLLRVRALWRRGARLDGADSDFDVHEYRPQTRALVHEAVAVERLRTDLPVYRIDGDYLSRLEEMPGSPEEKAAEVEAALEFEIRVRGGEADPVARSLAERLERIRQRKEDADAEMLSLLEDLAGEFAAEVAVNEALGLSERAQGFLALARAQDDGLDEEDAVALARRLDEAVAAHATVPDWAERDDVRRDIRAEAIRALLADEKTRPLVTPTFLDELMTVATARTAGVTS